MIEIILRDDITLYEPPAFWGMTRRKLLFTLATFIIAGATAAALFFLGLRIIDIGWVIIVEAIVIGVVSSKKFDKLPFEQYALIAFREFCVPKNLNNESPRVVGAIDKRKREIQNARKKQTRREKCAQTHETE